jgi:hypothetical protein
MKPSGFDPRRLADLASRLAASPAPAAPERTTSHPTTSQSPSPQSSTPQSSTPQSAVPQSVAPQSSVDARPDEMGAPAATGETTGPVGHTQVEAVLAELERAEQLPPDQQIPVYESVHRTLQETLRSIEQS